MAGVLVLAGCGAAAESQAPPASAAASAASSSSVNPSSSSATAQPKTLEAAVAAEQELSDRFASGDFAGAWMLYDKETRTNFPRDAFVALNKACSPNNGMKINVKGTRLETTTAVVRLELMGVTQSRTMVYEDGAWYQQAGDGMRTLFGLTADAAVAKSKSDGTCAKAAATATSTTSY
jgi:hypothetical protein